MFNSILKKRETLLLFLSMVINGLKCIGVDIGLDTCVRGRWREDVSKLEMNQSQLLWDFWHLFFIFFMRETFGILVRAFALNNAK